MDYCRLCGQQVKSEHWRDHMIEVHDSVLKESPKNSDDSWKDEDQIKSSAQK